MSVDTSMRIRPAAVAGMFYTREPQRLKAEILHYLNQATPSDGILPRAIIVPHAGYIYSAPVAACAYSLIASISTKIKQVILLGPSHYVAFRGMATPQADYFATPLGNIRINQPLCQRAESLPFVQADARAHEKEHSLEVQLPFLQCLLDDFELTPLVVGDCPAHQVAELLELLWGGDETLIIISTDLSHYHSYEAASRIDQQTSQAILRLQPENIHYEDACGRNPLNGLLTLAREKQLKIKCLDLRNSGDTAGSQDRVVGYGAYAVY